MSGLPAGRPSALGRAPFGAVAGVLNGLLGIGGGILLVPALHHRRGFELPRAVGTSLAAVVALSLCGFAAHVSLSGFGLGPTAGALAIGAGMLGAQAGAWLLARIPSPWVLRLFAVLVFLTALRLIATGLGLVPAPDPASVAAPPPWAYAALGAFTGLVSGLLGVGGGAFLLLGLAVFFDVPVHGGLPIALALNVTNALSGCWAHARAGQVDWPEVRGLAPGAVVGLAIGVALTGFLPADALRVLFGLFFLYMPVKLIRRGASS